MPKTTSHQQDENNVHEVRRCIHDGILHNYDVFILICFTSCRMGRRGLASNAHRRTSKTILTPLVEKLVNWSNQVSPSSIQTKKTMI